MDSEITFRPATLEDMDSIIALRNAPSVMRNFIIRTPLTREQHRDWYENGILKGQAVQFMITEEKTGTAVGAVYLRDIDDKNKKAEFGIFLGEAATGKGYGTRAAEMILEYAFSALGLNRVYLRVFADNAGAIRCYEKAGFIREGVFRHDVIIDNEPVDMVYMGILRKDWLKRS